MKKILITSMHFYPEQFRINDIALELKKRGYFVHIVTGVPNYPYGTFYNGYKVFSGLLKKLNEEWNGIKIKRLLILPRGKNKFTLSLNYLSYLLSGFLWSMTEKEKYDLIFVFATSPIFQALPAIWYSKRSKAPVYLYVQDLWPESFILTTGIKNKLIIKLIESIVNYIYNKSKYIFVTSKSMKTEISKKVNENKVIFLPQYAEDHYVEAFIQDSNYAKYKTHNLFEITYAGNIGLAQGLDILPQVARVLKKHNYYSVKFNLVGDGRCKEKLQQFVMEMDVADMFNFVGFVPSSEVPKILNQSDVVLLSYKPDKLLNKYIPAKLQTYMAIGKPIIAIADGETKKIIEEAKCGICIEPGNAEELFKAIVHMMNMDPLHLFQMGENGRKYYEENFSKDIILERLINYIEEV